MGKKTEKPYYALLVYQLKLKTLQIQIKNNVLK